MSILKKKIPDIFQDSLPLFIFFVKEEEKRKTINRAPKLLKSKYYNTNRMIYKPYYKPTFLRFNDGSKIL